MSDTVGFIRRLPERLLASFESTLSEITEASLLVIVVDAADDERELHLQTTLSLLQKIGAKDVPRFYVFNKLDLIDRRPDDDVLARWADGHPWVALSTRDAGAVAHLENALLRSASCEDEELSTFISFSASDVLALVYAQCRVVDTDATSDGMTVRIQGPRRVLERIRKALAVVTS